MWEDTTARIYFWQMLLNRHRAPNYLTKRETFPPKIRLIRPLALLSSIVSVVVPQLTMESNIERHADGGIIECSILNYLQFIRCEKVEMEN